MVQRPTPVRQAIKQTRPFPSRRAEALVGLLVTGDAIRRYLSRILDGHGITLQQYNVLRILRGAGPDGLPTLEIAERMIERTPGITRLLDRLERKRLVRRERCPTDRRQVTCRITEGGLALLARLDAPIAEADERALGGLSEAEAKRLSRMLDRVRSALA
jgi:DNA-binding MarR family transcriptional regulator